MCPTLSEAHYASRSCPLRSRQRIRPKQALSSIQQSIELDPTSPRISGMRHMMARCFYDLGQFGDALRWAHRAVIAPNAKSIAVALEAGAARKSGMNGPQGGLVGDLLRMDLHHDGDVSRREPGNGTYQRSRHRPCRNIEQVRIAEIEKQAAHSRMTPRGPMS